MGLVDNRSSVPVEPFAKMLSDYRTIKNKSSGGKNKVKLIELFIIADIFTGHVH